MRDDTAEHAAPVINAGDLVTVDQPGGTIALRDGVPVNPLSVQEAADSSLAVIGNRLPWLGPLLHSVAACDPDAARRAQVMSAWSDGHEPDPAKHEAYVQFLRKEIGQEFPWLWPLLDACAARVLITPGKFTFCTGLHLGLAFAIPALAPFTYLTPFAVDDGETAH